MFTIIARRWFQKTYGNTYHSVEVFGDNGLIGRCPFTYGYGEHYLQTAHKILWEAGCCPKDYHKFTQEVRNKAEYNVVCTDVGRKKDL